LEEYFQVRQGEAGEAHVSFCSSLVSHGIVAWDACFGIFLVVFGLSALESLLMNGGVV
jgi:hypothetical protein